MVLIPIALLALLLVVVLAAGSMKKKGAMTESTYATLVGAASVVVTIAALAVLFIRLRA